MSDDRCDLLCLDLPRAEDIRRHLDEAAIADAAARAKALGDPTRVTIAVALREGGELCVCDLAWITGRPENLVSHHLRTLRAAGLASSRREHKIVFYALTELGTRLLDSYLTPTPAGSMSTTPLELPIARTTQVAQQRLDPRERDRLIRRAKALSWLSLAYMTAEGAIAITAAILAGSVALLGFGLDSAIEALASVIVIWRFTGSRRLSKDAERRAERLVAISFFLLAPYIAQDAIRALIAGEHPHTSWLGIGLSISSIIVMPVLGNAKHRLGQRLDSGATTGEGTQNLLCAYLAAGVLTGLALNAAFGLWWADPTVALRHRRPRHQRRPPNLARPRLLRRPAHPWRAEHSLRQGLLHLNAARQAIRLRTLEAPTCRRRQPRRRTGRRRCNWRNPPVSTHHVRPRTTAGSERHQPPPGRGRDCWFVALAATSTPLLLSEPASSKRKPRTTHLRPMTRLVIRGRGSLAT